MADKNTEKELAEFERVSLTLPEDLKEWLYRFSRDIKRAGGYKLPNTILIRACIRAVKEISREVDINNIRDLKKRGITDKGSSEDLETLLVERIIETLKTTKEK